MTWRSGFPTGRHRRPLAWAIAGGLIALVACAQDAGEGVDVPTRPSSLPASTTTTEIGVELTRECVTTSAGYKVRYPDSWFVNDPGQAAACRFFHPEPFDVPPGTEATGIAISLNVEPTPFAVLALGPEGSVATTVRARVETTVAGRAAVRVDITSTGEGLLPSGTEGLLYFVDFGESTFVARTYGSPAAGTLASNAAVLDQMMGTLARMDPPPGPQCSAGGEAPDLPAQDGLPEAVAVIRREIVEAAVACDFDALAELARRGDSTFTHSFGGGDDPAAAWRQDETAGRPVLRTLVQVMRMPVSSRAVAAGTQYVWPSAFGYDRWQDVPGSDRDALRPIYGDDDLRGFEAFGSYAGYRVGITDGGDWIFFVGGD